MKLLRNLFATALMVVMPLAVTPSASAQTFNDGGKGCSVEELGTKNGGSFSVHGNTATTTVQVKGPASCKETVSLASWNTAFGSNSFRPLETQRFVAGVRYTNLGVGKHSLPIFINSSCNFQADIVLGNNPKGSRDNANYGPELMGYTQVFSGVCQAPSISTTTPAAPATPTSEAPAPTTISICSGDTLNLNDGTAAQGGNCSTNTTVVDESTPATPAPAPTPATPTPAATPVAAQPAALVNTGPGSVLTLFGLATVGGYFAHRKLIRKFI